MYSWMYCSQPNRWVTHLHLLTNTGQATGRNQGCGHTCWLDQVTLASPMLGRYTELTYTTHAQCMVYCIQYYDCYIKSWDNICNGIEVVIFYFLRFYIKIICPVLTVCWHLNIIQCSAMAHVSIPNGWCGVHVGWQFLKPNNNND